MLIVLREDTSSTGVTRLLIMSDSAAVAKLALMRSHVEPPPTLVDALCSCRGRVLGVGVSLSLLLAVGRVLGVGASLSRLLVRVLGVSLSLLVV
jgi:hypothetical protein